MLLQRTALLLALLAFHQTLAEEESTTSDQPLAATTLGTLFRQARSEHYYSSSGASRYDDEVLGSGVAVRADPLEHRDSAYFESRCITCDPNKAAAVPPTDRDSPYQGRWRQRGKYDYYDEEYDDRRYRDRDRYDGYYDRARAPTYDYDRYDPYGRNDLFRPNTYSDRYDPYDRDRYYNRPVDRPIDRPLVERPIVDRPVDHPVDRPSIDRPYDRSYERGNGYDNLDPRYPYDERYDRYGPPRRPPYEDYGPPSYDRYNGNRNYGRHDTRYDTRYDPYDRTGFRRPPAYDDRYDRYGGGGVGRLPRPDSRGYYNGGAGGGWPAPGGAADRPAYASAWNYAGGNRESWRDVNRERDRDRDRDRDSGFYRPRDYFYDSTAAPGGSRGTSYLYDRPESSTKPDADRDKPTKSPQTQEAGKNYKD